MKKLEMNQMEVVHGGVTPTKTQIICWAMATGLGFCNPVLGVVAGFTCLWLD